MKKFIQRIYFYQNNNLDRVEIVKETIYAKDLTEAQDKTPTVTKKGYSLLNWTAEEIFE